LPSKWFVLLDYSRSWLPLFLAPNSLRLTGVILYRTGDSGAKHAAPGPLFPHEGWDYEGSWGGFLGTPIAAAFFYISRDIGQAGGTTFTVLNVNCTVLRGFYDPQSDLVIWQIAQTFQPSHRSIPSGRSWSGHGEARASHHSKECTPPSTALIECVRRSQLA